MQHRKLLALSYFFASLSYASCGSSYCTVNTNWDTQGLAHESGWLADLRYAYTRADQWRAGSSRKATESPSGSDEEIENKRTVNQLLTLNLDYAIDRHWGVALGLPFVSRDHAHTFDSSTPAGAFTQQSKFSELGDVRIQGKYKFALNDGDSGVGLRFGFKLPTGATNKTMTPADPADPGTPYKLERSSQPGTGSTDGILGAYYFSNTPGNSQGWFISTQIQTALASRGGYRPGNEFSLDFGVHREIGAGLNLLLQLNSQYRTRDTGSNANAASGGYAVNLSPGLSYAVLPQTQVYAYVQLPIIRYLNTDPNDAASGQLSARWSASAGVTRAF